MTQTVPPLPAHLHLEHELHATPHIAIVAVDLAGMVRYWNSGCEHYTGWKSHEAVGRPLLDLVAGPVEAPWIRAVIEETRFTGEWMGRLDARRRDGTRFAMRAHATLLCDEDDRPHAISAVCVDVSEHLRSERRRQSAEDALRSLAASVVEGVVALDHDGTVQWLNPAAERMLGYQYSQLTGGLSHRTLHAGCSGDETCPIVRCRRTGAEQRVEDDQLLRADGARLPVAYTASPYTEEDGRRGIVVVFSDITARHEAETQLSQELDRLRSTSRVREALASNRLELHAQPILELATATVTQHELLLRLRDCEGRLIPPNDFLPAAEGEDLINDLDRWTIREGMTIAAAGHAVEINVSARSVASYDVLQEFSRALAETGADPSLVVVELTETAVMSDQDGGLRFIEAVKELGCAIALDDFGTGYCSLAYLKRLPVDFIKIDREFVSDAAENAASRHLVRTVAELARGLGQRTIAEGVEDDALLELLASLGVDFAQGYAIGRPAPASELLGS